MRAELALTLGLSEAGAERAVALASREGAPEDTPIPTAATVCRRLRDWIGRDTPEALQVRHDRALAQRRAWVNPLADGMAEFGALLNVVDATAIYDRLTHIAGALNDQPGEKRSTDQLRADTLVDLTLDGEIPAAPESARGIRANVLVTVPVMTLCGQEMPGELNGAVPFDPDTARRLAGESIGLTRILTHPGAGGPRTWPISTTPLPGSTAAPPTRAILRRCAKDTTP